MFPQRQRRGSGEGDGECNESRGVCHTDADPPAAADHVGTRGLAPGATLRPGHIVRVDRTARLRVHAP